LPGRGDEETRKEGAKMWWMPIYALALIGGSFLIVWYGRQRAIKNLKKHGLPWRGSWKGR
jgi:hypothetical protein